MGMEDSRTMRHVDVEGTANFRDLGGYATADGRLVKWGQVYRSDALNRLTPAGMAALEALRLRVICDFRGPWELEADGVDCTPPGAEHLHLPIYDPDDDMEQTTREAIVSGDPIRQYAVFGDGRVTRINIDGGRELVSHPTAVGAYSTMLRRLADSSSLPLLAHCTAGKDRTGWSSAIILLALGVPHETVIDDYLLTNELVAPTREQRLRQVARIMDPELLRPLLEVRVEYIGASFAAVEERHGDFASYLRDGLGIDDATLEALRENLLQK